MPSTSLNTVVDRASTKRFDRSAMASNTGCVSVGELAITLRMSAVAAWRCRASPSSLVSRVTLDSRFAPEDLLPRSAFGALRGLAVAPLGRRFLPSLPTAFVSRPISAPRVHRGDSIGSARESERGENPGTVCRSRCPLMG